MEKFLNRFKYKDILFFITVALLVFLTRLLFLSNSYGVDDDAWRIALAARGISVRQVYRSSRLPGYPVPEIIYSLVWQLGPKIMGGITAALSSLGSAFLYLTLRKLKVQDSLLIAFTFAVTPIIFINSTNTMDYLWSLSFMLGSLYYIYSDAPWPARAEPAPQRRPGCRSRSAPGQPATPRAAARRSGPCARRGRLGHRHRAGTQEGLMAFQA